LAGYEDTNNAERLPVEPEFLKEKIMFFNRLNGKCKLVILCVFFSCCVLCWAIKVTLFSDIDRYLKISKDIVIGECVSSSKHVENGSIAEINVNMVLKGKTSPGKCQVFTIDPLEKGETYLLMSMGGQTHGISFIAKDELSVVPVPSFIDLEILKVKNLKDQLHFIFSSRLYVIEKQLQPLLEEKSLLEKGLLGRTDNLYISSKPVHIESISKTWASDRFPDETRYIELSGKQLEWSKQSNSSGYIYSDAPGTKGPEWEFASIEYMRFEEINGIILQVRFSSVHIPPGGETRVVHPGQMVLARHIDDPVKIFVIKFDRQEDNKVFVHYAVINDEGKPQ